MKTTMPMVLCVTISGCAISDVSIREAAVADTASTIAVLEINPDVVEMNPAGVAGATLLKIPVIIAIENMEEGATKNKAKKVASSIWLAAATNNVALLFMSSASALAAGIIALIYLLN